VTAPHDVPAADGAPSALQLPHVWEEVFAGGRVQRLAAPVPPVPVPTPLPAPVPLADDDSGCTCHSCLYAQEQELEQELWELVQEREQILVCMRRLLRAVEKVDVWELLHDSSPAHRR
jgi:hypothetical protein